MTSDDLFESLCVAEKQIAMYCFFLYKKYIAE